MHPGGQDHQSRSLDISSSTLPEAVRAAADQARAEADRTEAEGRLSAGLVQALRTTGVFRMWAPTELGGTGVDPITAIATVEALATADASTGWCAMIGLTSGALAGLLPEAGARAVYSSGPDTIVGGTLAPSGTASITEGGYVVNGRWSFASGSLHSDWLFGGCALVQNGEPKLREDGRPEMRMIFMPTSELGILDNWDVMGLRGTGSNDFAATDVYVPEHLALALDTAPWAAGPLWRIPPLTLVFPPMAAVPLGIARAAIDELVALAADKVPYRSSRRLAERDTAQAMVAKAEAAVRSARAFVLEAVGDIWETAQREEPVSLQQRAIARLAGINAAHAAADAVDLCYEAGGATSIHTVSLLQRAFRDVHVATQSVVLSYTGWETVGRVLLGLEPDTPLL